MWYSQRPYRLSDGIDLLQRAVWECVHLSELNNEDEDSGRRKTENSSYMAALLAALSL